MSRFSAVFEWAFLVKVSINQFNFSKRRYIDGSSYSFVAVARQTLDSSEPQHTTSLKSSTVSTLVDVISHCQSAIGEKKRKSRVYIRCWCVLVVVFQFHVYVKMHVQVHFTIASTWTKKCFFIMIVLQRNFFHALEKNEKVKYFFAIFIVPVYLDIGEDYTSQNRYRVWLV